MLKMIVLDKEHQYFLKAKLILKYQDHLKIQIMLEIKLIILINHYHNLKKSMIKYKINYKWELMVFKLLHHR